MAEVRLIDAIAMATEFEDLANSGLIWEEMCAFNEAAKMVQKAPTIDPESLRPVGQWDWKHRHKGGFHKYTGVDEYGETHTITVDERFECDEPYCPNCGKWNESIYLNYCPNCGAKMEG